MKSFLSFLIFCCFSFSLSAEKTKFFQTQHIEIIIDGESNFYCFDFSFSKEEDRFWEDFILEGFHSENSRFDLEQTAVDAFMYAYQFESRHYKDTERKSIKDTITFSSNLNQNFNHWIEVKDVNFDRKEDVGFYWSQASGSGGTFYHYFVQMYEKLIFWKGAPMSFSYANVEQRTFLTSMKSGNGRYSVLKYKFVQDTTLQLIRAWNTFEDNLENDAQIMYDSILIDSVWEVRIDSNFLWEEDGGSGSYKEYFN